MTDDALLKTAKEAAQAAGAAVMERYTDAVTAQVKADGTAVTDADYAAHALIAERLAETGIPVRSEESEDGGKRSTAARVWIVDPLDGTQDFIERTDDFVVMIGLVEKGEPVLGVVYAPAHDVLYCAVRGAGAYVVRHGMKSNIRTSDVRRIGEARVVVSRSHFSEKTRHLLTAFDEGRARRVGSNGLKVGMIAEGKADVFFNPTDKMGEWDLCAPQIILEEAGGRMTDMKGNPLRYNKENPAMPHGVLSTNGVLHDRARAALSLP